MAQSPTTILVTRHGMGLHNLRTDVFMGRSPEAPLVDEGREQARRLGARLAREGARFDLVVASSLSRTMETAAIIHAQTGGPAPVGDDAFWELAKGEWEGRMPRPLPPEVAREVEADPFGYVYPGGESYREVEARVAPAFERWVARAAGGTILFVLHGDVIRALLHHVIGFPSGRVGDFEIAPCSLTEFRLVGGRYTVERINDAAHLRPD